MPLNINGRICVYYSIFWGLLALYFLSYVHPKIDSLIDKVKLKFSEKALKIFTVCVTAFLVVDAILTVYALEMFFIRKVHDYDLDVANKEIAMEMYDKVYENETQAKFINTFFGDKKMIKTFPNLKTQSTNGDIIYFDCFVRRYHTILS